MLACASDGLRLLDLLPTEQKNPGAQLLQELFAGERGSLRLDCKLDPGPKAAAWLRWTGWRVCAEPPADDAAFFLAEDVSEVHELQERLQQSEKLQSVGRLAGAVAHDFNNLLTGVLLYSDLLIMGLDPQNRLRKYAEEIRSAGMQASGLVRQLLTISRPTVPTPTLLSLNEITQSMCGLLSHLIGERIRLQWVLDPQLGLVRVDASEVQQVLLNLVLNARDAMPHGGQIVITTRNCDIQIIENKLAAGSAASLPYAMLSIADTGIGMDARTRDRVFEPFFTTKPIGKGTGLGLATVHEIVTRSGGLIYLESELGKGTCATVILPQLPTGVFDAADTEIEKKGTRE